MTTMEQKCRSIEIVEILQSFIHSMNTKKVRSEIIKFYIELSDKKNNVEWLGTWTVSLQDKNLKVSQQIHELQWSESLEELVSKNKNIFVSKICMFTVCIVYDINLVHFVSFLYFPSQKKLVSFDPGVELYLHGQQTILPKIRMAFCKNGLVSSTKIIPTQNMGRCSEFTFCGKKWGIQYNGNHKTDLPADSFCQTWSLFFLIRFLIQEGYDFSFVEKWCKVHPQQREFIIISYFMIPSLTHFSSLRKVYLGYVKNNNPQYTFSIVLSKVMNYVENCHLNTKKSNQNIKCSMKN
jgi:hypothetical protein